MNNLITFFIGMIVKIESDLLQFPLFLELVYVNQ